MRKEILKESIRKMVREAILNLRESNNFQNIVNEDDSSTSVGSKKSFVAAMLKRNDNDKFDHAHLAYQLWPNMNKDTARSYFSKCVRGERNFSDEEVTNLFNMLRSK